MSGVDLLGIVARLVSVSAVTMRSDRTLKLLMLLAMGLWAPYYWLLGGMSGVVFAALIAIRQALSLRSSVR